MSSCSPPGAGAGSCPERVRFYFSGHAPARLSCPGETGGIFPFTQDRRRVTGFLFIVDCRFPQAQIGDMMPAAQQADKVIDFGLASRLVPMQARRDQRGD